MTTPLHTSWLGPEDARHTAVIAHGILGSGRNWRSVTRRLLDALPGGWRVALVDLPAHGNSAAGPAPHTLASCAAALEATLPDVDVAIGHSFGGKVVLQWLADTGRPSQAWILDSPPGSRPVDPARIDTLGVIDAVVRTPRPAADRAALRDHLSAAGLPDALVAWLLTSARKGPDGWDWVWDLRAVQAMIEDYLRTDFVPWLERTERRVHLVRADRSDRWNASEIERLTQASRHSSIELHVLSNAGHWLHVDNGPGLVELMAAHWP